MGRSRYKFHENYYPYFITSSIVGGLPLFMNPSITKIVLDALCYLQNENEAKLYGYVIMPNHCMSLLKTGNYPENYGHLNHIQEELLLIT